MLTYLTAFTASMSGIGLTILGHQLGQRPAIMDKSSLNPGLRFTADEMSAAAAATRFFGLLTLVIGLGIAVAVTIINRS